MVWKGIDLYFLRLCLDIGCFSTDESDPCQSADELDCDWFIVSIYFIYPLVYSPIACLDSSEHLILDRGSLFLFATIQADQNVL